MAHRGQQQIPTEPARDNGEVAHHKRRGNAPPLGGAHVSFQRFRVLHTLHGQPKQAEANAKKHQRGQALSQVMSNGWSRVGNNTVVKALASSTVIMPYAMTMTMFQAERVAAGPFRHTGLSTFTGDDVRLNAFTVVDVDDLDAFSLDQSRGLNEVGVQGNAADVVQIRLSDGEAVQLRAHDVDEHGAKLLHGRDPTHLHAAVLGGNLSKGLVASFPENHHV